MSDKPLRVLDPEGEAQFFETVLRCVADGVFTVDTQWRITSFNRAAERITGVPVERAIGKRCSEVFHSDLCEHACPTEPGSIPVRPACRTDQDLDAGANGEARV